MGTGKRVDHRFPAACWRQLYVLAERPRACPSSGPVQRARGPLRRILDQNRSPPAAVRSPHGHIDHMVRPRRSPHVWLPHLHPSRDRFCGKTRSTALSPGWPTVPPRLPSFREPKPFFRAGPATATSSTSAGFPSTSITPSRAHPLSVCSGSFSGRNDPTCVFPATPVRSLNRPTTFRPAAARDLNGASYINIGVLDDQTVVLPDIATPPPSAQIAGRIRSLQRPVAGDEFSRFRWGRGPKGSDYVPRDRRSSARARRATGCARRALWLCRFALFETPALFARAWSNPPGCPRDVHLRLPL